MGHPKPSPPAVCSPPGIFFFPPELVHNPPDNICAPTKPFSPTSTFPCNHQHQGGFLPSDPKNAKFMSPMTWHRSCPMVQRVLGQVPPTLWPVSDPHVPRPRATGTHQLDLLLPGKDGGGAEVPISQGGRQERGADVVLAACSLGRWKRQGRVRCFKEERHWARLGPNWGCWHRLPSRNWSPCGGTHRDLGYPGCQFATLSPGVGAAPCPPPLHPSPGSMATKSPASRFLFPIRQ